MAGGAAKTKEERIAQGWAAWRDADFTWEGLKKRPWQGWVVCADGLVREEASGAVYGQPIPKTAVPAQGRKANLQDFWRADPANGCWRDDAAMRSPVELIIVHGQPTYHCAHLPLIYADGTPSEKAGWPEGLLDAFARARLIAAGETMWDDEEILAPDRRARFDGGVWPSFDIERLGRLPTWAERTGAGVGIYDAAEPFIYAGFSLAMFIGRALFKDAAFHGRASFESAQFQSIAGFDRAQFHGEAVFGRAQFHREAFFHGTKFHDQANFSSSQFHGDTGFDQGQFTGRAVFDDAQFHTQAAFKGTKFQEQAHFDRAQFYGRAAFYNAEFWLQAAFYVTQFHGPAAFDHAKFYSLALFRDSRFAKEASFRAASFLEIDFANGRFQAPAYFDAAKFQNKMGFTSAVFDQLASFESITWPQAAQQWHSAFDQVLFRGTLNIAKSGLQAFAAFDGATLERGIQIDEPDEAKAKNIFLTERKAAIEAASADGAKFECKENQRRRDRFGFSDKGVTSEDIEAHVKAQREARLKELERGCRVLKLAMEKASNKSREQMLYRFELLARRAQRGLPWGEALFSDLYGAASDYGASMVRPFGVLVALIVVFVLIYWGWGVLQPDTKAPGFWDALRFSLGRVAPFGPWGEGGVWLAFMDNRASYVGVFVRLVATFQTGVALVLAFLFALAVRRRFQIS